MCDSPTAPGLLSVELPVGRPEKTKNKKKKKKGKKKKPGLRFT
jgi:hypothetical protein